MTRLLAVLAGAGLLIRSLPRVVSKRLLIDTLAARNLELGDSAVEVYISRLRRKLDGSGVGIQTVRGFGYRLAVDNALGIDVGSRPPAA